MATTPGILRHIQWVRLSDDYHQVSTTSCAICQDSKDAVHFPYSPHRGSHYHDEAMGLPSKHLIVSSTCDDCWEGWVHAQVGQMEVNNIFEIRCPVCEVFLTDDEVKQATSEETWRQYETTKTKVMLKQDPTYHECPNANCSWGCILDTGVGNIFNCQVCKTKYCTQCNDLMHPGETCQSYQHRKSGQKNQDDEATKTWLDTNAQQCPNCGYHIEKASGCDHMTCRSCTFEFCYGCGAPYGGLEGIFARGNAVHANHCVHYSGPRGPPNDERQEQLLVDTALQEQAPHMRQPNPDNVLEELRHPRPRRNDSVTRVWAEFEEVLRELREL